MIIKNVNVKDLKISEELFQVKVYKEYIEFFRWNKHCLRRPERNERRWVSLPITFALKRGKLYHIRFTVESSWKMNRLFFLAQGRRTQVFKYIIPKDKEYSDEIEFISEFEGNASIVFTATDLPIAGHYLRIKQLEIDEG